MNQFRKLHESSPLTFLGEGYSFVHLERQMDFVPDWVPAELREFYLAYCSVELLGFDLSTPGPEGLSDNGLLHTFTEFQKHSFNLGDSFFPLAFVDELAWLGYFQSPEGTVQVGEWDFEAGTNPECYEGPHESLLEYLRSIGQKRATITE